MLLACQYVLKKIGKIVSILSALDLDWDLPSAYAHIRLNPPPKKGEESESWGVNPQAC